LAARLANNVNKLPRKLCIAFAVPESFTAATKRSRLSEPLSPAQSLFHEISAKTLDAAVGQRHLSIKSESPSNFLKPIAVSRSQIFAAKSVAPEKIPSEIDVTLNHTLEVRVRWPNELPLSERNPATDFAISCLAISLWLGQTLRRCCGRPARRFPASATLSALLRDRVIL
jgi:hypothetical protein